MDEKVEHKFVIGDLVIKRGDLDAGTVGVVTEVLINPDGTVILVAATESGERNWYSELVERVSSIATPSNAEWLG